MACLIIFMYTYISLDALMINIVLKCLTSYHFRHDKQVNGANTSCLSCNAHPVQCGRRRAGQYTISPAAIEAAIHFVEVCCQQAAYIAGRGELDEELKLIVQGTFL